MTVGLQHDAHEFLIKLLESVIETWGQKGIGSKNNMIWSNDDWNDISRIFKGVMKSAITCSTCHSQTTTTQPFYELNLDCEKSLLADEMLEGSNQYSCSNWMMLSDATKSWKIEIAPPILILNLNRFNRYGLKMKKNVDYPATLDLTPHVVNKKKVKLIYDLYALIIHEGRFSFRGHYFAYVKGYNNKWYKWDDAKVSPVEDIDEILTSGPYILFYRMKETSRKVYLSKKVCQHKLVSKAKSSIKKQTQPKSKFKIW